MYLANRPGALIKVQQIIVSIYNNLSVVKEPPAEGGEYRYLKPVRSGITGEMIREVAFLLGFDSVTSEFKRMKEYDGMSNCVRTTPHTFYVSCEKKIV